MSTERESITGIGGFFFRSQDPDALAHWYRDHFGILTVPKDYGAPAWAQQAGTTVFMPFAKDSPYFGDPSRPFTLNFRVGNLDRMVAQLLVAGIEVTVDPETYPNGRFARLTDPEGNPIELWEEK